MAATENRRCVSSACGKELSPRDAKGSAFTVVCPQCGTTQSWLGARFMPRQPKLTPLALRYRR